MLWKVFRDFFGVESPFADFYLPNLDPSYKFFEEPAKPLPGPDQEHSFPLTLEDAFYGTTKTIELPLQVVDESGTRTVSIVKTFTFRIPREVVILFFGFRDFRFQCSIDLYKGASSNSISRDDMSILYNDEQHLQPNSILKRRLRMI
ncbi:dnaJ subfamily B member 13 [Nephila pilipes]|uniref:DnaJ subfamily B member 13 n=1 Tax=Nephila pilipes TaxID=299642 RepID=A0A8X6MTU0_NEPPI|nr:dnaJ subfamily B member 13 [Nephila pilipes]